MNNWFYMFLGIFIGIIIGISIMSSNNFYKYYFNKVLSSMISIIERQMNIMNRQSHILWLFRTRYSEKRYNKSYLLYITRLKLKLHKRKWH